MKIDLSTASVSDMLVALPLMKDRLVRLGLFKTAQAQEAAVHAIGYEVAALADKERSHHRTRKEKELPR